MDMEYIGHRKGRIKGIVNDGRGTYGFVQIPESRDEAYFHRTDVLTAWEDCTEGRMMEYELHKKAQESKPYVAKDCRQSEIDFINPESSLIETCGASSLCGRKHAVNEDDYLLLPLLGGRRIVAAVADGLSNPRGTGDWASSEVLYLLFSHISTSLLASEEASLRDNRNTCQGRVKDLLTRTHTEFVERKRSFTNDYRNASSTLIAVVADGKDYVWGSAGDSVMFDIDFSGKKRPRYICGSAEERRSHKVKSPIGSRIGWRPKFGSGQLIPGHGLMLCTDGVYLEDCERIVTAGLGVDLIATTITANSIKKGNGDDATVVIMSENSLTNSKGHTNEGT